MAWNKHGSTITGAIGGPNMRPFFGLSVAALATAGALADQPAVEQDFSEIASHGCKDRGGDFIVRGMVSKANEDLLVLTDPANSNSRLTLSVVLPGRGPLAGLRGVVGKSREEKVYERLQALHDNSTVVSVTMTCKGDAAPVARNISFRTKDGTEESISY
jgi:hypothetical protein